MIEPSGKPTRAQQRRQTQERILDAARQRFAELGYDRTTIRGVAAAASVDAGLVMHYFGSKDKLFARATEQPGDEQPATEQQADEQPATEQQADEQPATEQHAAEQPAYKQQAAEQPADAPPAGADDRVVDSLLASLASRLDSEPVASLAVLRSMLTNADAAERYRNTAEPQLTRIVAGIPTADAELRASLLSAIVHGVIIERYLLRLGRLAEASPDQIVELLRPCFQTLAAADG